MIRDSSIEARGATAVGAMLVLGLAPFALNGIWLTALVYVDPLTQLLLDLLQFVVFPGVLLMYLIRTRVVYEWPKLSWPRSPTTIMQSVVLGLFIGVCVHIVARICGAIVRTLADESGNAHVFRMTELFPSGTYAYVYLVLSAALVEEFIFRFLPLLLICQLGRSSETSWRLFFWGSTALFAFAHWENGIAGVAEAGIVGATLAAVFWAFRNPIVIVIAHCAANMVAFSGLVLK